MMIYSLCKKGGNDIPDEKNIAIQNSGTPTL